MAHWPPPEPTAHGDVRGDFHGQLGAIDDAFIRASFDVAGALPALTTGFLGGDHGVMQEATDLSRRVGAVLEEVEDRGFVLLAREAPVAGDLRRLVALLRLTTDVDRSAALLKHVCLTLQRFDPRLLSPHVRAELVELAARAAKVFTAGADAWRCRDALAVSEVEDADDDVDRLQELLLQRAASLDEAGDEMLVLGLIARYYERIADHGVAIARDAAFVATGQRIRAGMQGRRARRSDA